MKNQIQTINYCVVSTPDDLIAFGRSQRWFFQEMEEKGVLKDRVQKGDWVYEEDCITFPLSTQKQEAYKRLDAVRQAGYPIKQVIYGWQVKEPKPEPERQFRLPDNTGDILTKAVSGLFIATASAVFVLGTAMVMVLQLLDPCLIVVIDTGQDEKECPWICLSSWEE